MVLHLDEFAYGTLADESAQLGVSADELAKFALLYYIADLDSGRIARRSPPIRATVAAAPDADEPSRQRRRER